MSTSAAQSKRIDLETLIAEYERARQDAGIGDRGWRLTPGQHLDAHRLVVAMREPNGVAGAGADVDVWVNHLAPLLAESGPAKHLLHEVLKRQMPDDKRSGLTREGDGEAVWPLWAWIKTWWAWIKNQVGDAVSKNIVTFGLVIAGLIGVIVWGMMPMNRAPSSSPPAQRIDGPPIAPRLTHIGDTAVVGAFLDAWATTTAAIDDEEFVSAGITPRRLAAVHTSIDPRLGSPDMLLANLLRAWPVPPDQPIHLPAREKPPGSADGNSVDARDESGLATLRRLTAEIAVLRSGLPRILFEGQLERATVTARVMATPVAQTGLMDAPWPRELRYLAGAPLLGYLLYALATHRRRVRELTDRWRLKERRSLRKLRELEGIKQTSVPLMAAPPEPFIDRASLRALIRYQPAAGRRLDAPKSVAALMRQEGVADPVMQRVQRAVSYLVIIQRRQPHDHERLRVRRLIAALVGRGLPVFAYDYDHDPLTVQHAIAASSAERAEGVNGREETLKLSTLRDLHPKARLVLVTDGRDLVDRIGGRVRADVVRELSFWRDRMVLTPVPVGDWGEVELALSRDLDVPLGRTSEEAMADLAHGFRESAQIPLHRLALLQARSIPHAGARLDVWWQAIFERFGYAASLSRGDALSFDQRLLATDIQPPKPVVEAIRSDLYRWLGPRGFLWHAACAIYPQLRYDLTVHIGRVLRSGQQADAPVLFCDTADDRRIFGRMTALPWFRSGRMPGWLRRDMLAALDKETLARATAVIRDLFQAAPGRQGPLAIWWPRAGALAMPPDAVMADAFAGDAGPISEGLPELRIEELRRSAETEQWLREAKIAFFVVMMCIGLWLFAPDFAAAPHTRGAWFPLFSFASACMLIFGLVIYARRRWPVELPLPRSRPTDSARSHTTPASEAKDAGDGPFAA